MKRNLAKTLEQSAPTRDTIPASPKKLAETIATVCEDAKGKDLVVLDVTANFGLVDKFIVVSGRSDRHVQGIANKVIDALEMHGLEPHCVEGFDSGQWVLIDFVDVVLHIFYEPLRAHYDLESLWRNAKKAPTEATTSLRAA